MASSPAVSYQEDYHDQHRAERNAYSADYVREHKAERAAYQKAYNATRPGRSKMARYGKDWDKRRLIVLDRDARVCWICGGAGADSVDHVRRLVDGGTHEYDNLRAAHLRCNIQRSSRMKRRKAVVTLRNPSRRWG